LKHKNIQSGSKTKKKKHFSENNCEKMKILLNLMNKLTHWTSSYLGINLTFVFKVEGSGREMEGI
jgi:hypothetical protein